MKMPLQFDTLADANKLTDAGLPRQQAEAHATALGDALSKTVVLPGDLLAMKQELLVKIDSVRNELLAKIDSVRNELLGKIAELDIKFSEQIKQLRWMIGLSITLNLAILVKLLVV